MDVVIPFVDCSDKVWMKNYLSFMDSEKNKNFMQMQFCYTQFYNYDTVKYVLRGIDKFMPYVENVFFVVSNIEQIPEYIDQSKVKVVLHKDFIPETYLPTFQANTIEMFMYNIPGLGEEFVYFNDDMIPVSDIAYDRLFKDGLPCIKFIENTTDPSCVTYRIFTLSFFEAQNTVRMFNNKNTEYNGNALCTVHGPNSFLKSVCVEAAETPRHDSLIKFYTSPVRRPRNLNQYYWSDILYFLGKYVESDLKLKYITTKEIDDLDIDDVHQKYQYLCINDFGSYTYTMSEIKTILSDKLNRILPSKCKYEK